MFLKFYLYFKKTVAKKNCRFKTDNLLLFNHTSFVILVTVTGKPVILFVMPFTSKIKTKIATAARI